MPTPNNLIDQSTGYSVLRDEDGNIISDSNGLSVNLHDAGGVPAEVDNSTHSIQVVDYSHHEQHAGSHYFIKNWLNVEGNGTVTYFMFITPDSTKQVHARAKITAESEFTVEIFEGGTVSDNGTLTEGVNNLRDSTNTSDLTAYFAPTVTEAGTLIWATKIGSGRNNTGVAPEFGYEIIAKRNTIYLFKITKNSTGTHYFDSDFWWYEHTPKD